MRNLDLTPLFRSTVGFDRLNDLFETAMRDEASPSYPPYNIEKIDEDRYSITMAIAGFKEQDINITLQKNMLSIQGRMPETNNEDVTYLYKGIANRAFERKFNLADYMKVVNAELSDGILRVDLLREIPEEVKPRQIPINGKFQAIEGSVKKK